jgi:hypothetical protein
MHKKIFVASSFFVAHTLFSVSSSPYIIRQPQPASYVVRAASYQAALSPNDFQGIMTEPGRRLELENLFLAVQGARTGIERLKILKHIERISTGDPELNRVFSNIGLQISILLKTTVKIFDDLLPAVNVLHNYFSLLQRLSTGPVHQAFANLHQAFLISLRMAASDFYGHGLWYYQHGNKKEGLHLMTIAQALLYRIRQEDSESMKLFKEIDTYQQVPFDTEADLMGIVATGGKQ